MCVPPWYLVFVFNSLLSALASSLCLFGCFVCREIIFVRLSSSLMLNGRTRWRTINDKIHFGHKHNSQFLFIAMSVPMSIGFNLSIYVIRSGTDGKRVPLTAIIHATTCHRFSSARSSDRTKSLFSMFYFIEMKLLTDCCSPNRFKAKFTALFWRTFMQIVEICCRPLALSIEYRFSIRFLQSNGHFTVSLRHSVFKSNATGGTRRVTNWAERNKLQWLRCEFRFEVSAHWFI